MTRAPRLSILVICLTTLSALVWPVAAQTTADPGASADVDSTASHAAGTFKNISIEPAN